MPDRQLVALANELRLSCMRISRRVRFESGGEIAPHQFSVLCRLEGGPLTPGQLADCERISAPSMTRTVAGLAAAGLVRRGDHPSDGRQVLVSLTPDGGIALQGIRRRRDEWMVARLSLIHISEPTRPY